MLREVIALEGNGARPSHMGKGFSEDGRMYTLNTIEQHSVCYGISRSALKGGYNAGGMPIEKDIQPSLVAQGTGAIAYAIENHPNDSRVTMTTNGIVQALTGRMGTGGGNTPIVLIPTCYAIDSNPTDSRIRIVEEGVTPTLTAHISKASAAGMLVLIKGDDKTAD